MNDFSFQITDDAAEYAKLELNKRKTPSAAIRIGVKGSGCNGYMYHFEFEDRFPRKNDIILEKNGINFLIDLKSAIFLNGSILCFRKTLFEKGLEIKNPNEKSTCGCGKSFNLREKNEINN